MHQPESHTEVNGIAKKGLAVVRCVVRKLGSELVDDSFSIQISFLEQLHHMYDILMSRNCSINAVCMSCQGVAAMIAVIAKVAFTQRRVPTEILWFII